jgi:type IV pilus assembly protein PilB
MRVSLGTLLIQAGVASEQDIKDALGEGQQTGERLGEVVIRKGLATDEQIAQLLAKQWQLPYAEGSDITVDDVAALRISRSDAHALGAQPVAYDGDVLVMAIAEPRSELFAEVQRRIGEAAYVVVSRSTMEDLVGAPLAPMQDDGYELWSPEDDPGGTDEGDSTASLDSDASSEAYEDGRDVPESGSADGLESIDSALEEFDRLRGVTAGLGEALKSVRGQLIDQQSALATLEEARERDRETIRRLEEEIATQEDLFATLRTQAAALAATLGAETAVGSTL